MSSRDEAFAQGFRLAWRYCPIAAEDRPERKAFLEGVKSPLRRYERPRS